MKIKSIHIILIVVLVVAILMITSSDSVVPYSRDTLFSNMYKYEGMTGQDANPNAAKLFEKYTNSNVKEPKPLSKEEFDAAISSMQKSPDASMHFPLPEEKRKEGYKVAEKFDILNGSKDPKKVEGFALQPSPFGDSKVLDRYSQTQSDPQCFGKSSGYSNSLGALCFSKEDVRLLSTRGGNISGTDSTIGL
jgi:hypothetical protein